MDRPLVSILIPVYNREKYIENCITSAVCQTYPNKEVIVYDNRSTDDSVQIIKKFGTNVRAYFGQRNVGPVNNWRRCLRQADGHYVMFLFSDDTANINFVADAVSKLTPKTGFVLSNISLPGGDYYPHGEMSALKFLEYFLFCFKGTVSNSPCNAIFRRKDMIAALDAVYRRDVLEHGAGPDIAPYFYCIKKYPVIFILDRSYLTLNAHEGNLTTVYETASYYEEAKIRFIEENGFLVNRFKTLFALVVRLFRRKYPAPRKLMLAKRIFKIAISRK